MKGTQPSAVLKNEAAEKEPKASLTHKLMSESESTKFIICENGTTIMKVSVVGLWELFSSCAIRIHLKRFARCVPFNMHALLNVSCLSGAEEIKILLLIPNCKVARKNLSIAGGKYLLALTDKHAWIILITFISSSAAPFEFRRKKNSGIQWNRLRVVREGMNRVKSGDKIKIPIDG